MGAGTGEGTEEAQVADSCAMCIHVHVRMYKETGTLYLQPSKRHIRASESKEAKKQAQEQIVEKV